MPDADLAALIRGEDKENEPVRPPTKKYKSCPYCTSDVLIRAQKCKYCAGDLTAMALQGRDWQTEPATDGQKAFLKKMKIKVGGPVSRAQAAGLLSTAKLQDPELFARVAASGAGQPGRRKGLGAGARAAVFLLIIGGAVGALHHFGKLGTIIRAAKNAASDMKRQVAPEPAPAVDTSVDEPAGHTLALQTDYEEISDPRAAASTGPASDTIQPGATENPMAARLRAEWAPPKMGSTLLVRLTTGGVIKGELARLNDRGISLKSGSATLEFQKKQLSDITRAVCYRDDYVAFRLAQHDAYIAQQADSKSAASKHLADEAARQARLNSKRRAQMARADNRIVTNRKKSGGLPRPTSATERAASVPRTSGNMSMREWMMKYNTDNARLLARQARVKAYEEKAEKEGLAY